MEKEKVIVEQRITVGEITLLPLTRIFMYYQDVKGSLVCAGSKNLIGIVAVSPKWKRAINVDGEEVPIGQYVEQVPEVKELLQSM